MDKLGAMRTFVEIVDAGSLTAAADRLDRSQPAVVRTLANLEAHLSTRLLQRTTRRMSLTPEGADYLERCRQILNDVDDAERAARQDEANPRGLIRVTAPVQFGQIYLAPVIARFLARYPHVEVDLVLVDRNVDFVGEGIDLGVRIGPLPDTGLIAIRLREVRRVVCASPNLLEAVGLPAHPSELAEKPCLRITNLSRPSRWSFRDGSRDLAVQVGGRFRCNTISGAVAACIAACGFGQFLSYQVSDHVQGGRLKSVLEDFEVTPRPVSLVYPGGRMVSARLRAVIDFLKVELSGY
jgi:DNA-binding transcriptional LysR family regulator